MAFALLTSLLYTIEFHFLQPVRCLCGFDREIIVSLCKQIRFLQAFLEESEKKKSNNDARRVLETKIRELAQDAEAKIESELHQFYMNCNKIIGVAHVCPVKPLHGLSQTLEQVKGQIESIERRIHIERNNNEHSVEPLQRRMAKKDIKVGSFSQHFSEPNHVMVGCDDEFDTIMHKLISASKELEVISIVGMGGIGKTTLVKRVYEDPRITSHFDVRAWTSVSQDHNLREMLVSLLGFISSNGVGNDRLASQLRHKLLGSRYLIVIDDIWGTKAWDDIHRCFPVEDLNGSRILLTTRLKQVADYAAASSGNNNPHHMRFLNPSESWNLFYKKVFEEKKLSPEFETIGRGIVKKCQGLPLTIIVVAGLLASFNNPSLTQWENIVENLNSFLNTSDPEEKCSKILSLSYDHLPLRLKVCFLYFGVFPEDSMIHVKKLISLWIAEGFVNVELEYNLEGVGETYLQDLVDRGLVQIVKRSSNGKIKRCRLHDLLHNFCLREAQRENLLDVINENNVLDATNENIVEVARVQKSFVHKLAIRIPKSWIQKLGFKNRSKLMKTMSTGLDGAMSTGLDRKAYRWISNHLDSPITHTSLEYRSILYFPKDFEWISPSYSSQIFPTYPQLLRVLDISQCDLVVIPSEILNLVLLRYLALRTNASLHGYEWYKLQSLQTFIVEIIGPNALGEVWKSPIDILDMPRLRHVMFSRSSLVLPMTVQRNLETVSCLYLRAHCLGTRRFIRNIPYVKTLGIYIDITPVSNPKLLPVGGLRSYSLLNDLFYLSLLEKLKIDVPQTINFQDAFRLPTVFPPSIKTLTLERTCLPWDNMATIATLPNLKALKLKHKAFCGPEWKTTENGFRKLKYLKIMVLDFEHWSAHFPVLECLKLDFCRKLKEFPIGFADITTLELIELTRCGSSLVASAQQIQQDQSEFLGHDTLVVRDYSTFP